MPPEPSSGSQPPDPGLDPGHGLLPDSCLGPFRLVASLGSGATGSVWTARLEEDAGGLPAGCLIALKLLHPHLLGDDDARARFAREGRVAVALRHPFVVSTLGMGSLRIGDQDRPWLAMEIVEGRTLRDLMHDLGRIPEPLLRDLARQLALGLAAIHAVGVVHRDLKPSNIIITSDQRVRIMDLGVAVELADEARLTRAGMFVGTLLYASPEQFGRAPVGPASDLYGVGVLLYEAITGTQPFDAPDIRGVVRKHLEMVPARAGEADPVITPFFEELLACLLEKDPSLRPSSAESLAGILEQGELSPWWIEREASLRAASPHGEIRRAHAAPQAPLIGRETEMSVLRGCLDTTTAGASSVIVLEGEAGVGKSRLVEEFVETVHARSDGAIVLQSAHAPGEIGGAHDGLLRALLDHFGMAELGTRIHSHLASTPRLATGLLAHVTGEPLPAGEPPLSLESLGAAACGLVRALASEAPLLAWVVEDLHFASAESRSLVLALARLARSTRFMLVVTSRPQGAPELDALAALAGARRLLLHRLSPAEVVRLIAGVLGSEASAERIGGKIARRTDGNPFFILEMLREMKERGFLQLTADGRWRATGDTAAFDIPSSVRDVLHGRLRDLKDQDRTLLDAASVVGFHFDPDLVARVLDRKRLEVLQSFAALARRTHLVQPTGSGFQFEHHQMQEIVYKEIPNVLRSEYHALIADSWRERAGKGDVSPLELSGDDACFLAGHLLRGGRGAEGARFAPRAMGSLMNHSDLDGTASLGELALEALDGQAAESSASFIRYEIAMFLASSYSLLGRRQREREMAEMALECARQLGDPLLRADALRALGNHLLLSFEYAQSLRVLEDAAALSEAPSDPRIRARILGTQAATLFRLGEYQRAREINLEYADLARAGGDIAGEAAALGQLGNVLTRLGDEDAALAMFERSAELARQAGRRRLEALSLTNGGVALLSRGEHAQARACLERATAISIELGHGSADADGALALSYVAMAEGKLEEARQQARHATGLFSEAGLRPGEAAGLDSLAVIEFAEGRLEECRELVARCLEMGHAVGSALILGYAVLLESQLHDMEGHAAAGESLGRALQFGESVGDRMILSSVRIEQVRRLLASGDAPAALAALEQSSGLEPAWLFEIYRSAAKELARAPSPSPSPSTETETETTIIAVPEKATLSHRVLGHAAMHLATGDPAHRQAARDLVLRALKHLDGPARERALAQGSLARWAGLAPDGS